MIRKRNNKSQTMVHISKTPTTGYMPQTSHELRNYLQSVQTEHISVHLWHTLDKGKLNSWRLSPWSRTSLQLRCCLNVATYKWKIHNEKIELNYFIKQVSFNVLSSSSLVASVSWSSGRQMESKYSINLDLFNETIPTI
jgi:hypothetical protein